MLAQCIRPKGWLNGKAGMKFIPFGTILVVANDPVGYRNKFLVIYEDAVYHADISSFKLLNDETDIVSREEMEKKQKHDEQVRTFKIEHAIDHLFDGL